MLPRGAASRPPKPRRRPILANPSEPGKEAQRFFGEIWAKEDAWAFDSSPWERERLDRLRDAVSDRRYARVLEIGCGAGHLTERLLPLADALLGIDVAEAAIDKARARLAGTPHGARAELRAANAMELDLRAEEPFDLVVLTETVCYLGWLYPFFNLAWFAREVQQATRPGGRLLLANTLGEIGDALVLPWIIKSYHDLFRNAGYETEREEMLRGTKDGVAIEVLVSLLRRPA
jgi:SAM-dependent methyltransferase